MPWNTLEPHFSSARLGRYKAHYDGDTERALTAYRSNIELAAALVPLLNVLEISLRNGIHRHLVIQYGRADWWVLWQGNPDFDWQCREISAAERKLIRRNESCSPEKIIAELQFGFWSSLFNAKCQDELWQQLRLVFTRCPKRDRRRKTISRELNKLRDLRNRAFHHEPLLWLHPPLPDQHQAGQRLLEWINPVLLNWLEPSDRFSHVWASNR